MKIMHIAPEAPYNEGWGYQENLLPKYQQKSGHEVMLVVANRMHIDGKPCFVECSDGVSADGFRVVRRPYILSKIPGILARIRVDDLLEDFRPDFIFFHGFSTATIFQVISYKKRHPECVIVQDNHLDKNIGHYDRTLRNLLFSFERRMIYKLTDKYISRVYGVTPWRKSYAHEEYGVPEAKTDVLIMGADDEKIDFAHRDEIRARIRSEYGIDDDTFLILSGGKLDKKKNILQLMEAMRGIENAKLMVFGKVLPEIEKEFAALLSGKVIHIGWIDADKVYDYFFAADLVAFPGQHSVLWEQACASKVPVLFARWEGMEHVNNGGNAAFLDDVTPEGLKKSLEGYINTPAYEQMKQIALSDRTDIYLYSRIAEKSVECANKA